MLSQALKGVRVLDFTRLYPGPLCTLMMSDLGADVIKVEAPGGEFGRFMKSAFEQLNRGKRSLTLDLKNERARDIVRKLLRGSDVLVESFRPGVMHRLGLDYENIRESFPRLIYCSISGYGQTGKNAQRAGHDINYISVAGLLSSNESAEKSSGIPPVQIADVIGGFQGIAAILSALFQRTQTQTGQFLDISLVDGAFFAFNPESSQYLTGKLACYNIYRTSDDRYLSIAMLESKFWNLFCERLGLLHLVGLQFHENQTELTQIISEKFAQDTLQYWLEFFRKDDLCITPVLNIREAMDGEYGRQRGTPFIDASARGTAPRLSEHTHEILEEAGYAKTQIDEFVRNHVI